MIKIIFLNDVVLISSISTKPVIVLVVLVPSKDPDASKDDGSDLMEEIGAKDCGISVFIESGYNRMNQSPRGFQQTE